MIRSIEFSNFYSFKETQKICFVTKRKKNSYSYFKNKDSEYLTKIAGFIGGNASGKTNVMRVFGFISNFACSANRADDDDSKLLYKTYYNSELPSFFDIEFEIDETIYYYKFALKNNEIQSEKLQYSEGTKKMLIFNRKKNRTFTLNEDLFIGGKSVDFLKNVRNDVSSIAFIKSHFDIDIINKVFKFFGNIKININEFGSHNIPHYQRRAIEICLNDAEVKKQVDHFIRDFDVGLDGFEIKEADSKKGVVEISGLHTVGKNVAKLDFIYESRGTKSLFFAISNIFYSLKHSGIAVIDELETGLHPETLSKLITYFIDQNMNTKAQLIFSSLYPDFMNKLDMHQIFITEKESNKSSVFRLTDVDGIRTDENFRTKYMAGHYGGFPNIRI